MNSFEVKNKVGQVTIFVIIAMAIVAGIVIYLIVSQNQTLEDIPVEFVPIYSLYSSCIDQQTRAALDIAGTQGGRIYISNYEQGSEYAPFSSTINFLGFNVPYWYYVAGNGIVKENLPSKQDIEEEVARYLSEQLRECSFDSYYAQGYSIELDGKPEVKVVILDDKVSVFVNDPIVVSKDDKSAVKSNFNLEISSKFGKFYDTAKEIYNKERQEVFLENYGVDVMRLYAPVDGVQIGCSPKVWKTGEVVSDLKSGLEANINRIRLKGNYYSLINKSSEYYVIDQSTDEAVNFVYSKNWPTKIEITGANDELMLAQPIGNQQGLGAMGFCYAPYHFVYDISFPVIVQIYNDQELFQFPIAVVIDKNLPREGAYSLIEEDNSTDICAFATQDLQVRTYDSELNPLDNVSLSYSCFDQSCSLGKTEKGQLSGKAPACFNGYLEASTEGYKIKREILSTNDQNRADIILDKEYEVELNLIQGGKSLESTAIVNFIQGESVISTSLPESPRVKLSEGMYNISVYVYGNTSITIPASIKTQCTEVAKSGFFGLFGGTKEQCFDINLPETKIESALIGGGVTSDYLFASDLSKSRLTLKVDSFSVPQSLEQLQYNYEAFDKMEATLEF